MSTSGPSPTAPEPRGYSVQVPHWGWFLLATAVLLVIGIALSIWMPYRQEQEATRRLEACGAVVETLTRGPEWLRWLLGYDRRRELKVFDRVFSVRLGPAAGTDAALRHVIRCSNVEVLNLENTSVTDRGLAHVGELANLKDLNLDGTTITDAGIARLTRCTDLHFLHLSKTKVTDAGLADLAGFSQLKCLFLANTAITDAGLAKLTGLTRLDFIILDGTAITSSGIEAFRTAVPCDVRK